MAGNFNMTNVEELFDNLVKLGQHPKREDRYRYGHGKKSEQLSGRRKPTHF